MTKASGTHVLALIEAGERLHDIEVDSTWAKGEIVRLAREEGFGLNVGSDRFQRVAAPSRKPAGIVRIGTDLDTVPVANAHPHEMAVRPAQRDLIAEGKAHSVVRVQRLAIKAEQALEVLDDALRTTREAEAAKVAAAAEATKRAARIAELEALLAAEKAAVTGRPIKARTGKRPGLGVDLREMKAWCTANDVPYPAAGRPTNALIAQYPSRVIHTRPRRGATDHFAGSAAGAISCRLRVRRALSTLYSVLAQRGVIRSLGYTDINDDTRSGNAGKPARTWEWVGPLPAAVTA